MADVQGLEEQREEISFRHAEAEYQLALELIGTAREELYAKLATVDGKMADDIKWAIKNLTAAWKAAQSERDRVAEYCQKLGRTSGIELDLDAARTEVCEQLDRIARAG